MTIGLAFSLAGIFALLVLSAFFAGSETALTAVSKARMHHLASEGSSGARHVAKLIGDRERLIGALLLGNTFVNILSSALATSLALMYFGEGEGLLIAMDLPDAETRSKVRSGCWDRGLAVLVCGTRSIRFRPPLDKDPTPFPSMGPMSGR